MQFNRCSPSIPYIFGLLEWISGAEYKKPINIRLSKSTIVFVCDFIFIDAFSAVPKSPTLLILVSNLPACENKMLCDASLDHKQPQSTPADMSRVPASRGVRRTSASHSWRMRRMSDSFAHARHTLCSDTAAKAGKKMMLSVTLDSQVIFRQIKQITFWWKRILILKQMLNGVPLVIRCVSASVYCQSGTSSSYYLLRSDFYKLDSCEMRDNCSDVCGRLLLLLLLSDCITVALQQHCLCKAAGGERAIYKHKKAVYKTKENLTTQWHSHINYSPQPRQHPFSSEWETASS